MKIFLLMCVTAISMSLLAQDLPVHGNLIVDGNSTLGTDVNGTNIVTVNGDLYATAASMNHTNQLGRWGYGQQFTMGTFGSGIVVGYNKMGIYKYGLTTAGAVDLSIWNTQAQSIVLGTSDQQRFEVKANGDVWIGLNQAAITDKYPSTGQWPTTEPYPNPTLHVNGFIETRKLKVTQTGWADYVFANGYKLRSLKSVQAFITKNKHLPDVPSADKVTKDGLDVGSTQATLLRKIEELTLYVIDQQQQLDSVKKQLKKALAIKAKS